MKQLPIENHTSLRRETAAPARTVDVAFREINDNEYGRTFSEGGLHEYLKIIRRHKWIVLLAGFIGAVGGLLRTLPQTPIYQAHTTVEVRGVNENFLNMRDVNPDSGGYVDPSFDILTQVRILESSSLAERAVNKLTAQPPKAFLYPTSRLSAWKRALGFKQGRPMSWHDAVSNVAGSVEARAAGTTRIIDVSGESADPQLAANYVNTLVSEFIDQSLEARLATSTLTSEWLSKQLEELKIKLEKSEDQLQAYASSVGLQLTGGNSNKGDQKENVAEERFRQLQTQLLKAQADRVAAQSKYELTKSASADSLPQVLEDLSLQEERSKLVDLRREMAELSASLTSANPKVQKVQAQINELESAVEQGRNNVLSRIANDYQTAERQEHLISGEYEKQLLVVGDQAAKSIHYNILEREVDTNRQIYEAMLQKVKEAGIASAIRASGYRVIDLAAVPGLPYKPNPSQSATMGAMAGLLIGIVLVMVRERADRSLQQPGDVTTYLNVPELGVIPSEKAVRSRRLGYGRAASGIGHEEHSVNGRLTPWKTNASSLLMESFQATLTSILFSTANEQPPNVLVITSANPSEGKSMVSSNIAVALAQINRRVVLVDADMRRPKQHSTFDVPNDRGLTDLLRESGDGFDLTTLRKTDVHGLWLLSSGPVAAHASNLLHSSRLPELLQTLRLEFDTVIIDTPPMLHLADARLLSQYADAVVLVVRAGKTTRDAALAALRKFREDGTPLLGTIFNDWDPGSGGYGTGYYTGYKQYGKDQEAN